VFCDHDLVACGDLVYARTDDAFTCRDATADQGTIVTVSQDLDRTQ